VTIVDTAPSAVIDDLVIGGAQALSSPTLANSVVPAGTNVPPIGGREIVTPASPQRVWDAITRARSGGPS